MFYSKDLNFIAVTLIILLGIVCYGNSLKNGFVYDDFLVVKNNPFITSWQNLKNFFNKNYFLGSGEFSYRPITTLTYFVDYALWKNNPAGYHLTNLLLHISNGILLYFFLLKIIPFINKSSSSQLIAILSALFFISHPIHTESVDCIAFRSELLYTLFLLLSFSFHVKSFPINKATKSSYVCAYLFYFLALLSKETALVYFLLLLIVEFFIYYEKEYQLPFLKFLKKRKNIYLSYIGVILMYIAIRFFWMATPAISHRAVSLESIFQENLYHRLITFSYIFVNYIKLLLFPVSLTSEYVVRFSKSIFEFRIWSSLLVVGFLVFQVVYNLKRNILFSFCGAWFFISLIPASNFIPLHHPMAERYLYLPSIGFCMFLAGILVKFHSFLKKRNLKLANRFLGLNIILLLSFYSLKTIFQNRIWKNEKTFWSAILKKPGSHTARVYTNLGVVLMQENNFPRAIKCFKEALKVNPSYIQAYNNLGLIYYEKGEYEKAIEAYKKILDSKIYLTDFDFIKVYSNLGVVYLAKNMPDKAIECFNKALELNPFLAKVYANLGKAYLQKNLVNKAIEYFDRSIRLNPNLIKPYYNLGLIFLNKGLYEKAIEYFKRATTLNSKFAPGYYGLALCYYYMKDYSTSLRYSLKCLQLGMRVPPNFLEELKRKTEK